MAAFFGPITAHLVHIHRGSGAVAVIPHDPEVLLALNPVHGVRFHAGHGMIGLVALGVVFLAVTGAEALYADLGHFGRKPIQTAWVGPRFQHLLSTIWGRERWVLSESETLENPFFLLYPQWMLLPMVVLATAATVIASQAVITGASRSRDRLSNSACCRGWRSATRRKRITGKSTCRV